MKRAILHFSNSKELNEFLEIINHKRPETAHNTNTLLGKFSDAELELAKQGFGAAYNSLEASENN